LGSPHSAERTSEKARGRRPRRQRVKKKKREKKKNERSGERSVGKTFWKGITPKPSKERGILGPNKGEPEREPKKEKTWKCFGWEVLTGNLSPKESTSGKKGLQNQKKRGLNPTKWEAKGGFGQIKKKHRGP